MKLIKKILDYIEYRKFKRRWRKWQLKKDEYYNRFL